MRSRKTVPYKMYAKTYVFGNKNQKLNTDSRSKETAVTGGQLYDAGLGYGFVTEDASDAGVKFRLCSGIC